DTHAGPRARDRGTAPPTTRSFCSQASRRRRGLAQMISRRSQGVRVELILGNVLVLALIGLFVYFSTQSPYFLTSGNIKAILVNDSPPGVVVVPLTLLIIAGHVDLSIGSNAALSAMVAAIAVTEWNVPTIFAFVLAMVVGAG